MVNAYVNRYRNAEYLQYMKDVVKLVNKQDVNVLLLVNQRDALVKKVIKIEEIYQQGQGSSLTQEIIDLDARRDSAFIGIKTLVNSYGYHFNKRLQEASEKISKAIQVYGTDVTRKSYQEETAIITSLLNDLVTKESLVTALSDLGVTEWIVELRDANENFTTKYLERVEEKASNPSINVTSLREETTVLYKELLNHIEAHKTLTKSETYLVISDEIEVLTKQYNLVVDNRTIKTTESL